MLEKLSALQELEHQIDGLLVLVDPVEIHNVGVVNLLHDMYLFFEGDGFLLVHLAPIHRCGVTWRRS